jgi:hypothetical protein
MKAAVGFLILASALRAAVPQFSLGGAAGLNKAVDARAAKLGKVALADGPLARIPRKGALVRVAFSDVLPVPLDGRGTAFVGHHVLAGVSDFALVTFPDVVEISTRSAAVVIGSYRGQREIAGVGGAKTMVTVIAARVVGVAEGAAFRVYETPSKKAASKKAGS